MSAEDKLNPPSKEEGVPLSSEGERAFLLASVMKDRAERDEARTAPFPPERKRLGPQLAGLALATLAAVYVWFGSPSWLGPEPLPPPSLADEQAALQAALWIAAQQVEAFEERNGRIPGAQELGPLPPGVRYRRVDAHRYVLDGFGEVTTLSHNSGQPQDHLLAGVRRLLTDAGSR